MDYDFAYFKHLATYEEALNNEPENGFELGHKTIVFVGDNGKIYTHGSEFGGNPIEYTQGEGVIINNDHSISLDMNWIQDHIEFPATQNPVTYTAGYAINITNNVISVDRDLLGIHTGGGSTTTYVENPYNDTQLRNRINDLQTLIAGLRSDLDDFHNGNEEQVKEWIKDILKQVDWLTLNFPVNLVFSFGNILSGLKEYLIGIGLIDEDENVGWGLLIVKCDELDAAVNRILSAIGEDGRLNLEVLEASLKAYVDTYIAGLDLTSKYAVQDENQEVIQWMVSGFKSQAGKQQSEEGYYPNFAAMFADEHEGTNSAIAAMKTTIEHDVAGKISAAKAEIGSEFNGRIAGLISESDLDSSMAAIFAENENSFTKAAVLTAVKEDQSTIDLIAQQVNVTGTMVANAIQATDLTLNGKITATNADIKGTIHANRLYTKNHYLAGGTELDFGHYEIDDESAIPYRIIMQYGSCVNLPDAVKFDGVEIKFFYPSYKEGARPSYDESPYITYNAYENSGLIYYTKSDMYADTVDHKLYIGPGREVTVIAVSGDWYVTDGDVSTESYN